MLLFPFENTRSDWSRAASAAGLPRMLCKTDYKVVLSYKMCVKCLYKCIKTQNGLIVKLRILLIIDMDWPIYSKNYRMEYNVDPTVGGNYAQP